MNLRAEGGAAAAGIQRHLGLQTHLPGRGADIGGPGVDARLRPVEVRIAKGQDEAGIRRDRHTGLDMPGFAPARTPGIGVQVQHRGAVPGDDQTLEPGEVRHLGPGDGQAAVQQGDRHLGLGRQGGQIHLQHPVRIQHRRQQKRTMRDGDGLAAVAGGAQGHGQHRGRLRRQGQDRGTVAGGLADGDPGRGGGRLGPFGAGQHGKDRGA